MAPRPKKAAPAKRAARSRSAPEPPSIADEIKSGDRRRALEAVRNKLADDLVAAPATVVAQIAGRLTAVLAELDGLPRVEQVSRLDELRAKREQRRPTA